MVASNIWQQFSRFAFSIFVTDFCTISEPSVRFTTPRTRFREFQEFLLYDASSECVKRYMYKRYFCIFSSATAKVIKPNVCANETVGQVELRAHSRFEKSIEVRSEREKSLGSGDGGDIKAN